MPTRFLTLAKGRNPASRRSMTTEYPDVEGLVLAGGTSRRFGSDKPSFPVQGLSMAQRVVNAMSPLVSPIRVSMSTPQQVPVESLEHVLDMYPGLGPLAGIHAGLVHCTAAWLLVVAADYPFISSEDLRLVLDSRTDACRAVVAEDGSGRLQPLCACYRRDARKLVEDNLQADRLTMQDLIHDLGSVETVKLKGDGLRNINRPSDLPPEEERA